MGKIDEMIKQMCPEGVKRVKLEEVCGFQNGFAFKSTLFKPEGKPIVRITNINGVSVDDNDLKYFDINDYKENLSLYEIRRNDILVAMSGATTGKIGISNLDYTLYLNQRVGKFIPDIEKLNNRYLYHILRAKSNELYIMAGGGAQPNLSSVKLMKEVQIPLPPLPIQEAIVEILDKFDRLSAELQAELQARKTQYEYYRNQLLTRFAPEQQVTEYSLGELCDYRGGYTPSKNDASLWENGTIPWFRMEDIRDKGRVLSEALQKVNKKAIKKNGLFKAGSIIVATSATIGEHALILTDFLANQRFTCFTIKDAYKKIISNKYLFYQMFLVDEWCKVHTNQGGFASVDMTGLYDYHIQVPSLSEQARIVSILDKFEALVNDLSQGLPAEIEAVKEQYEYYRNKLLTFDKIS